MSCPQVDEVGKQWEKEQGAPFCTIADAQHLRTLVPVTPADYRLLKDDLGKNPNLAVDILIQGRASHSWKGRVGVLPEAEAKEVPKQLTSKAGGPLAEKPSSNPNIHVPQNQQYLIPISFLESDGTVCPGTLARVKIHCRWRSGALVGVAVHFRDVRFGADLIARQPDLGEWEYSCGSVCKVLT